MRLYRVNLVNTLFTKPVLSWFQSSALLYRKYTFVNLRICFRLRVLNWPKKYYSHHNTTTTSMKMPYVWRCNSFLRKSAYLHLEIILSLYWKVFFLSITCYMQSHSGKIFHTDQWFLLTFKFSILIDFSEGNMKICVNMFTYKHEILIRFYLQYSLCKVFISPFCFREKL